jgi:hypothetical protein
MLKPYFKTLEEEHADEELAYLRELQLRAAIETVWPTDVDAEISLDNLGKSCIRAFVYLQNDASEETTKTVRRIFVKTFGRAERNLRPETGRFYWFIKQPKSDSPNSTPGGADTYDRLLFIENAHNETCTVKKVTKTVEVFESSCPKEPNETDAPVVTETAPCA